MGVSRALFLCLVAAGIGALVFLNYVERTFESPGPLPAEIMLLIPPGSGLSATAGILAVAGAVQSRDIFALGAWMQGASRELKAGEYRIAANASMSDILEELLVGDVYQRRITIAEGTTSARVHTALDENLFLSGDSPEAPLEGSVAPDTYFFVRGESRTALLGRMTRAQQRIIGELWESRSPRFPLRSPREALILASIVEKESALQSERARIAAVFLNRLERGMRLQSDPTVIYGLTQGEMALGRALTRADLRSESPYNTYRIRGLPPRPISNPGRTSIEAALNPAETDDLYFVADGEGGHAFARTLAEHNRNVARWRRLQREAGEE